MKQYIKSVTNENRYIHVCLILRGPGGVRHVPEVLRNLGSCVLQGSLTIISTTYLSEKHLKRRQTLEMGMGKSLICGEYLKRRLLK